jgi:toxin FitB
MNVVDSSGWLEILVGSKNAAEFERVISEGKIVVPAISIFEVSKRASLLGTEKDAQRIEQHMRRFNVIELTADRTSAAARLGCQQSIVCLWQTVSFTLLRLNSKQLCGRKMKTLRRLKA